MHHFTIGGNMKYLVMTLLLFYSLMALADVAVYSTDGIMLGYADLPDEDGPRLCALPAGTTVQRDGATLQLPTGSYVLAPTGGAAHAPITRDFGFDDATSCLPQQEMDGSISEGADLNGDGYTDIVVTRSFYAYQMFPSDDHGPRVYMQQPDGTFTDETDLRIPQMIMPSFSMCLLDADLDGDTDIFIVNNCYFAPWLKLLINDGNGYFTDESDSRLPAVPDGLEPFKVENICLTNPILEDLVLVYWDVNNSPNLTKGLLMLCNDGTGHYYWDTQGRIPPCEYGVEDIIGGDFDGDGDTDMVYCCADMPTQSAQRAYMQNNGDGFLSDETTTRMPEYLWAGKDVIAYDYDLDGDLDLLDIGITFVGCPINFFNNDGSGHFTISSWQFPPLPDDSINEPRFGLLNDDIYPDLFMPRCTIQDSLNGQPLGYDMILISNGDGTFNDETALLPPHFDFSTSCVLFDYQNDGDLDAFVACSGGSPALNIFYGQHTLYENTLQQTGSGYTPTPPQSDLVIFPNPGRISSAARGAVTSISYHVHDDTQPTYVSIYSITGRKISQLCNQRQTCGKQCIQWNAARDNAASGIYVVEVKNGVYRSTGKMVLIR